MNTNDGPHERDMATAVKQAAAACGYVACGITDASRFDLYENALRRRIKSFPEAAGLYVPMLNRADPRGGAPWVNAIVVCVRDYGKYRLPPGLAGHIGRHYLADRRIPSCPDFDMPNRMTKRLRHLGLRVKRGGVPERLAGARAGVVRIGRNGFAYHGRAGSWINLESWRVDAPLPADRPSLDCPCPAGCRACIEACPSAALESSYMMRMDRCVAHLTYGAEWPVSEELQRAMGAWIYGCDDCQTVCPLNRGCWREDNPAPWLEAVAPLLAPKALAQMDGETFRRRVYPLFRYIPEDDVARWRANAARALRVKELTGPSSGIM